MKTIPLSNSNEVVIVDDEDYASLCQFRWMLTKHGYVRRSSGHSKKIYMHREIMGFPDSTVDHADGNRLNNSRSNLRNATIRQNVQNSKAEHRKRFESPSRFKGVSWDKIRKKWKAYIGCGWKCFWLGRFDTQEEAAQAYNAAAERLHGEFARKNTI